MAIGRTAAEFDEISPVYDATREPLGTAVLDAIASTLRGWEVRAILEVGVGTGRVAGPLAARGFGVTGLDASAGMLAQARRKGLERLVRGSAYALPFDDGRFDIALFVHVLHVLDDPKRALAEACRVGARGAVGLVRPRSPVDREPSSGEPRPRALVIERLRAEGIDVPANAGGGPPRAERRLLEELPPAQLVLVHEEEVTEPLREELRLFERRASRWTLRVPPEAMARAVASVRAELGDRTHRYHHRLALARWERPGAES